MFFISLPARSAANIADIKRRVSVHAERLTAEGRPTLSGGGKWHFSVVARLLKKAQK